MQDYQAVKDSELESRVAFLERKMGIKTNNESKMELNFFSTNNDENHLVNLQPIEKLEKHFETTIIKNMIFIGSMVTLYSNGSFNTSTTLKDDSRHRKYENTVIFSLKFNNNESDLRKFSSFSGDFSPGETKSYDTSGEDESIKNNWELIVNKEVEIIASWDCSER